MHGDIKKKSDKPAKIAKMRLQVANMKKCYPLQGSLVTLSKEQYRETLAKMQHNIDAIPLDTPWSELQLLKNHVFTVPDGGMCIRLPVQSINDARLKCRGEDMQCKGCDEKIKGRFVRNLTCMRTKFHPSCAAVLISAVGKKLYYDCMGRMSSTTEKGHKRSEPIKCRHPIWSTSKELSEEIEEARAMFLV